MHVLIKRLWKHWEPELKRCVARGEYARERELRSYVQREADLIREELIRARLQRPPFMTRRAGICYMHPVTEENVHLIRKVG